MTTLVGREGVKINVGGHTHIEGAMIANIDANGVDQGNLVLNTNTLSFADLAENDDYRKVGVSASSGGGAGQSQPSGGSMFDTAAGISYDYRDVDGVTKATIGNGTITIRDTANQQQNVADLNRDINNMRETSKIEKTTFEITIPLNVNEQTMAEAKQNIANNMAEIRRTFTVTMATNTNQQDVAKAIAEVDKAGAKSGDSVKISVKGSSEELVITKGDDGKYYDQHGNVFSFVKPDGSYEVACGPACPTLIAGGIALTGAGLAAGGAAHNSQNPVVVSSSSGQRESVILGWWDSVFGMDAAPELPQNPGFEPGQQEQVSILGTPIPKDNILWKDDGFGGSVPTNSDEGFDWAPEWLSGGSIFFNDWVDLTDDEARRHILSGDATGGGHKPGTGISGKTEFPSTWSDSDILNGISDVATSPDSIRTDGRFGRTVVQGTYNGVDIRVIVDSNGRIVTGFPTNLPRNP